MKDYGRYILNELINKYEKNKCYGKPEPIPRGIFFYFRKKYLPDYFIDSTAEYKLTINARCRQLEERGFICISWLKFEKGNLIDKVKLNPEKADSIYDYLGRESLLVKEEKLLDIIHEYRNNSIKWLKSFYEYITTRLEQHDNPVYLPLNRPKIAEQLLLIINAVSELKEETPIRLFSMKHSGDSKLFHKLESKVIRILRDFNPDLDEGLNDNEVLAEVGLIPNPDYLYLSGHLCFLYKGKQIRVDDFDPDLGLPIRMLKDIKINSLKAEFIMTIENLTPYQEFIRDKSANTGLIIYLGGFHNRWRRKILTALNEYISNRKLSLPFYHWGDIDYGGLMILKHLREATNIAFKPYKMDVQTIEKYQSYCQSISDQSYINSLLRLVDDVLLDDMQPVLNYMLDHKVRLEQEALIIPK